MKKELKLLAVGILLLCGCPTGKTLPADVGSSEDVAPKPEGGVKQDSFQKDMVKTDAGQPDSVAKKDGPSPDVEKPDLTDPDMAAPDLKLPDLLPLDLPVPDAPVVDAAVPDVPDMPMADQLQPDLPSLDAPIPDATVPDLSMSDKAIPDLVQPDLPVKKCGDGIKNGTEQCDGKDLDNKTCTDKGFAGGTLACSVKCTFDTYACSGLLSWATSIEGSIHELIDGMAVDSIGNTYITGSFRGTAKFGTTTLSSVTTGSEDVFVAKLDASGKVVWATSAGGKSLARGRGVAVDNGGNSYVTGIFAGTLTFGSTILTSIAHYDIFAAKIDPTGKVVWAKSAGGAGAEQVFDISVDTGGNSYITGGFTGTVKFDNTTLQSKGDSDIFVVKRDSNGKLVFATSCGGKGKEMAYGVRASSKGEIYVSGHFRGTATFGSTTLTSKGYNFSIFTAKLDSFGNSLWATSASCSSTAGLFTRIALDNSENIYLAGNFSGSVTFGSTTLTAQGYSDGFVAKLNSSGKVIWANSWGGLGDSGGSGIAVDSVGNSFIVGYFSDTITCGATTIKSSGQNDVLVTKLNTNGKFIWASSAGGKTSEYGSSVAVDISGKPYVAGNFSGTATFGKKSLTALGSYDIFVWKPLIP